MSSLGLQDLRVDLVASDPWDFCAPDGSVRFAARIVKAATYEDGVDEERLLIEVREEVHWRGTAYRFFVARHRHGYGLADDLIQGRPIECSLVAISGDDARSPNPMDTSGWRGGLAVRATLEPTR